MIKVYGMEACSDCRNVKVQIKDRTDEFEYLDIASSTTYMKEFLKYRDNEEIFDEIRENGKIGIPCFIKEDGSITLDPEEVGLKADKAMACSLEDHLKGKKGC